MVNIDNSDKIDGSYLNRSKLHLNKSGTALLVKIFSQALKTEKKAMIKPILNNICFFYVLLLSWSVQ